MRVSVLEWTYNACGRLYACSRPVSCWCADVSLFLGCFGEYSASKAGFTAVQAKLSMLRMLRLLAVGGLMCNSAAFGLLNQTQVFGWVDVQLMSQGKLKTKQKRFVNVVQAGCEPLGFKLA